MGSRSGVWAADRGDTAADPDLSSEKCQFRRAFALMATKSLNVWPVL